MPGYHTSLKHGNAHPACCPHGAPKPAVPLLAASRNDAPRAPRRPAAFHPMPSGGELSTSHRPHPPALLDCLLQTQARISSWVSPSLPVPFEGINAPSASPDPALCIGHNFHTLLLFVGSGLIYSPDTAATVQWGQGWADRALPLDLHLCRRRH